jgi:hypothetical protein
VKIGFDSSGAIKASINAAVYGNDYMTFNVGSDTERMRLDASGNLGIGVTPSGSYRLEVNGGGLLTGLNVSTGGANNSANTATFDTSGAGAARFYSRGANASTVGSFQWRLQSSNGSVDTQAMTLDASGNLGIGITSPGQKLHVENSVNSSTWTKISNGNSGTGAAAGVLFGTDQGDAGALSQNSSNAGYGTAANAVRLRNLLNAPITFETNNTERARIDSSGNLGLGVTPSAWGSGQKAIQVGSSGAINGSSNTSLVVVSANRVYNGTNDLYINTAAATAYQQSSGAHAWFTAPSGTAGNAITFTQAMTLDASGNLGVGTTSPGARLTVAGGRLQVTGNTSPSSGTGVELFYDGTSAGALAFARGTGYIPLALDGSDIRFNTSSTERARITSGGDLQAFGAVSLWPSSAGGAGSYSIKRAATNALAISYDFSGAEMLRITSGGDLLVGDTANSAGARLYVKGSGATSGSVAMVVRNSTPSDLLYIRNDGLISLGLAANSPYNYTTGSAANAFLNSSGELQRSTSSLRYKTNVQEATHGLAEVLALRAVTYKGINDGDKVFGGLIAEEVHDSGLTEFVAYDEEGRPDALHYGNMVSVLVKAIQEQQAIIEQLKADVAALKGA